MSTSDSGRDRFDNDDELRALLRGGDPAGSLPPADPAALASLLEDIMSADLDIRPVVDEGTRATGTRGRGRLTWLVAAAAAAAIAGVGGVALNGLSGDEPTAPTARESTDPGPAAQPPAGAEAPLAGQTTELTVADPQARCQVPTPALLAQYTQAFQGEVTAVEGDSVTLTATGVCAGDVGETVQVTAPAESISALVRSADFQVGQSYYVAAWEGQVSLCGYSGPATGTVAELWQKAFLR